MAQAARVTGVKPPSPLLVGANARQDWIRWKEDWTDYATVQDLAKKSDAIQTSLFRISVGADGKKLLRNQPVPEDDDGNPLNANKLATLLLMMEKAVIGEVNDTFERYVFRSRTQRDGETIDVFLLTLRELMKTCEICEHMVDKTLKDQVIFGVRDDALREKLLQERQLTLVKCIDMCRAAESASLQAKEMTHGASEVNKVSAQRNDRSGKRPGGQAKKGEKKECRFCGLWHVMSQTLCPAHGKQCNKCGDLNHFARKCTQQVEAIDTSDDVSLVTTYRTDVGAVTPVTHQVCAQSTGPRAKMRVHGRMKAFLLDTGASANLISSHDVDINRVKMTRPGRRFTMWNGAVQEAIGQARIAVYNPKTKNTYDVNFDIVSAKLTPILGCSAVQKMGLIKLQREHYESVQPVLTSKADSMRQYPQVFKQELGTLEGKVSFQVRPQIVPTARLARQVPVARRQQQIKDLPPIPNGTKVWYADWRGMRDTWCQGQLLQVTGRSYLITTNQGTVVRRNRVHVKPDVSRRLDDDDDDTDDEEEITQQRPEARRNQGYGFVPPVRTRSGRTVYPVGP